MKRKLSDVESKTKIPALLYQIIANIPIILDFLDEKEKKEQYDENFCVSDIKNKDLRNLLQCNFYLTRFIVPKLWFTCDFFSGRFLYGPYTTPYIKNIIIKVHMFKEFKNISLQNIATQITKMKIYSQRDDLDFTIFSNLKEISLNNAQAFHKFPKTIQKIVYFRSSIPMFTLNWSCSINTMLFPCNLTSLTLPDSFDSVIMESESLTKLDVGYSFNQSLPFFPNLIKLILGDKFDQCLTLSASLTSLSFGKKFNQPIQIPPNLTSLNMGESFNQIIYLPITLHLKHLADFCLHNFFGK
jgi:hypothetical protein